MDRFRTQSVIDHGAMRVGGVSALDVLLRAGARKGRESEVNTGDRLYLKRPFYGSPRTTDWLSELGWVANEKRVARLMRVVGLATSIPICRSLPLLSCDESSNAGKTLLCG
jgi:hypothetical protein